jgi:glycerophosphoryl diester phosphodiesterase
MIRTLLHDFQSNWRSLLVSDLVMKSIAFAILTPLVSVEFDAFLKFSGRSVLTDADIAYFLLHPIGWCTAIVIGGGALAILALEQAALMSIVVSHLQGQSIGTIPALRFTAARSFGIFQITWRLVARLLLVASPFVVAGGALYAVLLTDHDINFYLSEKPPKFWLAVVLIGAVLGAMTVVLLRLIAGWALSLPLYLFEGTPPRECLSASNHFASGQRMHIVSWIAGWFIGNAAVSTLATSVVVGVGYYLVGLASSSLWSAILAIGFLLLAWTCLHWIVSAVAVSSLSMVLVRLYLTNPNREELPIALQTPTGGRAAINMTRGRIAAVLATGCVVAAIVGAEAIHGMRLEDHVQITSHRGASGKAPENTLASVQQAIADGTDWVEIDVQETKDGVVIVAHDSDLKKVSGVDSKIWDATAAELRSIDIGSYFAPSFASERVPTLAEVLEACRGRAKLNIELKYYGHDQNLEQRVIDLVEQHDMQHNVVLMSLESRGIRKAKQLRPDWTVGLLTAVAVGDLTRAEADFFAVNTKLATPAFIQAAHRKQKTVSVWTVNDPVTMSVMISRGVDNIITDYPDRARQVLADRASLSPVERMMLELTVFLGKTPPLVPRGE